jgi:hypothetical protein
VTSKDHQNAAEHHIRMGKIHQSALKKAQAMEDGDGEEFHKASIAEHAAMAEDHLSCCKTAQAVELSKASMGTDRDDQIRPDGISVVIGDVPANIRPVFRAGQQQFARTEIPQELEKLVSLDD